MLGNCSSCRFYRGTSIGACHRYPSPTRVSSQHWCGEYKSVDVPKTEPHTDDKKTRSKLKFRPIE